MCAEGQCGRQCQDAGSDRSCGEIAHCVSPQIVLCRCRKNSWSDADEDEINESAHGSNATVNQRAGVRNAGLTQVDNERMPPALPRACASAFAARRLPQCGYITSASTS